ncbi:MAG: sulfur carrier protein ThiS [Chloracidobacterium sp.]|nr:sulfur carrier protein ThiS [Chloracidobacterium sp.]MDW8217237.1 sulfur carrier protein ThiS [Acidobacteriota bacterium]
MEVTINGEKRMLSERTTLAELLTALGLTDMRRVAVEHNGALAPRAEWDKLQLADGDRLEIVHFVGGG